MTSRPSSSRPSSNAAADALDMLAHGRDYLATVLDVITSPPQPAPPRRHARRKTVPLDVMVTLTELRDEPALLAWHVRELHDIGDYTYDALGDVLGLTGARIGQLVRSAVPVIGTPPVEPPPPPPGPPPPPPPVVTAEIAHELATLQRKALKVRGNTPADDPGRVASATLARRFHELHLAGASYRRVGDGNLNRRPRCAGIPGKHLSPRGDGGLRADSRRSPDPGPPTAQAG